MWDEKRTYAIIVCRVESADNELYVNLEATSNDLIATSMPERPQIHCDLKKVKWLEVISKLRNLSLGPDYNIDLIEGLLKKGDMGQLQFHCTLRDLEAIGFTTFKP